jgi:hypothetical protein
MQHRGILGVFALLWVSSAHAQLDTRHWIPTLWASEAAQVDNHCLMLSTPEISPTGVVVSDGTGAVIWQGTVSNEAPIALRFRGTVGCGVYNTLPNGPGALGHVQAGSAAFNRSHTTGLVIEAERPVYANIRHRKLAHGESLTAKGRKALGTRFRAGFLPEKRKVSTFRGQFVSVMATEDNTTVTFDDFKPGVVFFNTMAGGNPRTSRPIVVPLQAGETYIVGIYQPNWGGTANLNEANGLRISSDRPVAMVSGNWLGGPGTGDDGQDIGMDQAVPVELAGTEFVLLKGNASAIEASSAMETPVVIATENDTNVYVHGLPDPVVTPTCASPLPAGGYCFLNGYFRDPQSGAALETMLVRTSRPTFIYQMIAGSDSSATPGMNVVPQLAGSDQTEVNKIVQVEWIGAATLGIITRAGAEVTINGQPPAGAPIAVVGTDEWVAYEQAGMVGDVSVRSTASLAVTLANVDGDIGAAAYFSGFPPARIDLDQDGVLDGVDNCPDLANPDQANSDGDIAGDVCDLCPEDPGKVEPGLCGCGGIEGDPDEDGVLCADNCPFTANPGQADSDGDGRGDFCEDDGDGDGLPDPLDGCPEDPAKAEPLACGCGLPETDSDLDGTPNCVDTCVNDPAKIEPGICGCGTADDDADANGLPDCVVDLQIIPAGTQWIYSTFGDVVVEGAQLEVGPAGLLVGPDGALDWTPGEGDIGLHRIVVTATLAGEPLTVTVWVQVVPDGDGDGIADLEDSCPVDANADQADLDLDGIGDVCDDDLDGDEVLNADDNCPSVANGDQVDGDGDGQGDLCDEDADGDGVADTVDNCPGTADPDQTDTDSDGAGNPCDADDDGDGIADLEDLCPQVAGADTDTDGDGQGDACDADDDGDEVGDAEDNCPGISNADQADTNSNDLGDACDPDDDGDTVEDAADNCPLAPNADQADADGDGVGDVCDTPNDGDADGVADDVDNCPAVANPGQEDADEDGVGDACEAAGDGDADGVADDVDNCPAVANPGQEDADESGVGDACEEDNPDRDGDGVPNPADNCPEVANSAQSDQDEDSLGDACDDDLDGDGIDNRTDNCPNLANVDQLDVDGDSAGDPCDPSDDRDNGSDPFPEDSSGGCACDQQGGSPASTLLFLAPLALLRRRRR